MKTASYLPSEAPRVPAVSPHGELVLREACGLAHEPQVIEIVLPAVAPGRFVFADRVTGRRWPGQRAAGDGERGYLFVELPARGKLELQLRPAEAADDGRLQAREDMPGKAVELSNGLISVRCFLGEDVPSVDEEDCASGPVLAVRSADGPWRGRTFFDVRSPVVRRTGRVAEAGGVRIVYQFRAELRNGGWYEAEITLDRGAVLARVRESFGTDEGDQLVWDLSDADLPAELHLLDSTAGMASRWLDYSLDRRQARLWCWTQQSQLFDLVDGFTVTFSSGGDSLGMVALAPGAWRGRQLNHVEVWARRWNEAAPWTRRRVPAESRADAVAGPDGVPARGRSACRPHLTLEAWLGKGRREFGLVLAPANVLWAGERGRRGTLEHFELEPAPERYRAEQGLLRRLHIQRGLFCLQEQLGLAWEWPEGERTERHVVFDESLRRQIPFVAEDPRDPANIRQMTAYLEARVLGFWAGSGAAYSNPVVSRKVAPYMEYYEWLCGEGLLAGDEHGRLRAWLVFLAALFASEHYYPGEATMRTSGDVDGTEPTLQGMANQNFYTDVLNIPGMAAQVLAGHPSAADWRSQAVAHWGMQLDYHVYPESGVWEESHTYYLHVLFTMVPLLKRWRDAGVIDYFADTRLQKLVGSALAQVTPRDVTYGGTRHLLAWGDHDAKPNPAYVATLADYATGFAPHAPELAAELAWLVTEMGGDPGAITPRAPMWSSGDVRGLGFVFRTRTAAEGEALAALRAGAAWGHHHNDDGSLQVFALGRAWIVDVCHGHGPADGRRKFSAQGHSRAAAAGLETANYLWRFSRGWIAESDPKGSLPYAVAWLPTQMAMSPLRSWPQPLDRPFFARRAVVQLAPRVFAVIDEHDGQREHEVVFHLAVDCVEADGPVLRGSSAAGRIELTSVSAAGQANWEVLPQDQPADGDASRGTWPCRRRFAGATWHLTVIAVLVNGEEPPVVTTAANEVMAGGCRFLREGGAEPRWSVSRQTGESVAISFSMGFGNERPV